MRAWIAASVPIASMLTRLASRTDSGTVACRSAEISSGRAALSSIAPKTEAISRRTFSSGSTANRSRSLGRASRSFASFTASTAARRTGTSGSASASRIARRTMGVPSHATDFAGGLPCVGRVPHQLAVPGGRLAVGLREIGEGPGTLGGRRRSVARGAREEIDGVEAVLHLQRREQPGADLRVGRGEACGDDLPVGRPPQGDPRREGEIRVLVSENRQQVERRDPVADPTQRDDCLEPDGGVGVCSRLLG